MKRASQSMRRGPRGYVLVMVLAVLLVLTLLVAGLYSTSEDSRFTAQTMMGQRVAAARADQGAQLAIAQVRSGAFTQTQLAALTPCTSPATQLRTTGNCATGNFFTSGLIDNGAGDLDNRAGHQFQWWVYKQSMPDGTNPKFDIFHVYAEGYYGLASTSTNYSVAAVVAEITLPGVNSGPPNFDGDYGVIH